MREFCFLLLIVVGSYSFGQTKVFIPEPYGDNFIESELITDVSFVSLKLDRNGLISPDMELKVDSADYFILDNQTAQCVYHFNGEGELLNIISQKKASNGNEDLPDLTNPAMFNMNPFLKQIEIYNFENSVIQRFGYDGKEANKVQLEINPSDFVRDESGNYWIYMGWHNSNSQYRLIKADSNGKVIDRKMRLITNCTPTEGIAFYLNGNEIYLWESFGNTAYSIVNGQTVPKYLFDFGVHNLPLNYHLSKPEDSYKFISEAGYYTVKKFIGNNNFDYLFLNYNSTQQREMFHVIYDKQARQVFVYTENSAIGALDKAQAISNDNELIFLVSPRKVRQLLSGGSEFVPASFMNIIEDLGSERNPVILKIKLQSLAIYNQEAEETDSLNYEN